MGRNVTETERVIRRHQTDPSNFPGNAEASAKIWLHGYGICISLISPEAAAAAEYEIYGY